MRVLLSGQAGVAAVIGDQTTSLHSVDRFDCPVTIHANGARQAFIDATDVAEFDTDDLALVEQELRLRWQQDRALHLILMALDCDVDDERRGLLENAEALLRIDAVADFVEARLHRDALPDPGAATHLIDIASLSQCSCAATLLTQVLDAQPAIAKFASGWQNLPVHSFGTAARKLRMRRRLDEARLWHRMVRLRWTYEWHEIAAAIEGDDVLRRDAVVFRAVLPELLYSCRGIHVTWPTMDSSAIQTSFDAKTWKATHFFDDHQNLSESSSAQSVSGLWDTERSLVKYAQDFDSVLLDDKLRDAETILLVTHHWQDRKNEPLRRSWAARDSGPLHLWLERLATVTDACPLHVASTHGGGDAVMIESSAFDAGPAAAKRGLADRLKLPLRVLWDRPSEQRDGAWLQLETQYANLSSKRHNRLCHSLAHAWHASKDLKVTSCLDTAGLQWMEHVINALPGADGDAAAGFLQHPNMIQELLVDSPKTRWEWAASHALRVMALRSDELDLVERLNAPCLLSTHAVAVAQLWRAEWRRSVEALEPMNDPVADVLRIHAYGALRWGKQAREAYDRARDAVAPALSFARETLYNRFIRGEADVPDQWLFDREVDMLAEAA